MSCTVDLPTRLRPGLDTAKVFLLGAGGLGVPVALFLAEVGIGHLVIADGDRVELSNLHRQILHATARVTLPKVESLRQAFATSHPALRLIPLEQQITADNIRSAMAGCDLAVDGSDNFETRYLLNRVCGEMGIPLVSGAVLGWEGQVATFYHGVDPDFPCYRCLHPQAEVCGAEGGIPTCASAGVLGPVAGMIGALQAVEVVKVLSGAPPTGSLLLINLLENIFLRVAIPKDPECPVCGGNKTSEKKEGVWGIPPPGF
ncbi:MAG: HesA/MoeB/ThiF family protein [Magnetococcales bacterium]|nr:HesA/MoeB/ThiF family protein [Magnetococcales bacterium]